MALNKSVPTSGVALLVCLSALLNACSSPGSLARGTGNTQNRPVLATTADASAAAATSQSVNLATSAPRAFVKAEYLEADAPDVYEVVRGDTLWDISDRFLTEPWLWPQIWQYNPQIANPHLIYPGDIIALEYVNGQPSLVLTQNGNNAANTGPFMGVTTTKILDADGNPMASSSTRQRMSPRIREESLDGSIPTIPGAAIQQFLIHPRVVDADTINGAPYVLSNFDNRLISATGHQIYVRGTINREQTSYGVYRQNKELRDPVNGSLLGFEVTHVANAKLLNVGDPSTLTITDNKMETIAGDILLPSVEGNVTHQYTPRIPEIRGDVRIVSLVDAISQTGRNQVVVLNIGKNSSIEEGDVLAIESAGKIVVDPRSKNHLEKVRLPNLRTGVVMVFKTFDKVSYALVMESTRPVMINDIITGI